MSKCTYIALVLAFLFSGCQEKQKELPEDLFMMDGKRIEPSLPEDAGYTAPSQGHTIP
jgi:hypothetical protein